MISGKNFTNINLVNLNPRNLTTLKASRPGLGITFDTSKIMATSTTAHLNDERVAADVQIAAGECQAFLLSASYRAQGEYEVCDDTRLTQYTGAFFTKFAPQIKVRMQNIYAALKLLTLKESGGEKRIAALRFSKRAILPVKQGATVDLLPVIISGEPLVSGKEVRLGSSLHLTRDVVIEPAFYCLAILAQWVLQRERVQSGGNW